jgi:hypothetical protein
MHSITLRNPLFMEGTDLVYSCMFFYLILSQCGKAYSLDNWLRCRRLARAGRLSVPGGRATAPARRPRPRTRTASRPSTAACRRGRACS